MVNNDLLTVGDLQRVWLYLQYTLSTYTNYSVILHLEGTHDFGWKQEKVLKTFFDKNNLLSLMLIFLALQVTGNVKFIVIICQQLLCVPCTIF